MKDETSKIIDDLLEGKVQLSFEEYPKVENTISIGELLKTWLNDLNEDN